MTVVVEDGSVVVQRPSDRPRHKALHGLSRSLLQNMVTGVTEGYEKRLEIVGVGYRFVAKGKDVDLSAGFSHPVVLTPPDGIEFKVENQTEMAIVGIDKDERLAVAGFVDDLGDGGNAAHGCTSPLSPW